MRILTKEAECVGQKEADGPPPTFSRTLSTTFDQAMVMTDEIDEDTLARDMIEVHGAEAPTVAREDARAAARAGQVLRAKLWIRVLGFIQRRQAGQASPLPTSCDPSSAAPHKNK
jgi:hypothetical protein